MKGLFDISSNRGDSFTWSNIIPPRRSGLILPLATPIMVTGGWGDMIMQFKEMKEFTIWHSSYFITQRRHFTVRADVPAVEFSFLIHNSVLQKLTPLNQVIVKEAQFNIFYVPNIENKSSFEAGEHYTTLDVHCTVDFLKKFKSYFPEIIDSFLENIDVKKPVQIFSSHLYATNLMIYLVKDIIRLLSRPDVPSIFLELDVMLLLSHALACKAIVDNKANQTSLEQLSIVHWVSTSILKDLATPPSISQMSRSAGMNTTTFKKMFKQINDQPMYDYWSSHRMDEARNRLLNTNDSIKSIALDLGFSALSNFSKAFKKQFLVAPSYYRKNG